MRKRCKRKPRTIATNIIDYAIIGARKVSQAMLTELQTREFAAFLAFKEDRATLADYRRAADILNLTEFMARDGIGPEALEATNKLTAEMVDAAHRFERTGRMSMSSAGVQALFDVAEYHDLQRQELSHAAYESYIQRTENHILGAGSDVLVLDLQVAA